MFGVQRALALLLLGLALSSEAQSWDLGSDELHPTTPWEVRNVRAAGSRHGHLAVWLDPRGRMKTFAARIASDGRVLDPAGIPLGGGPELYQHSDPLVASDGEDYVAAWTEAGIVTTASVDREGKVRRTTPFWYGTPEALVSNGRTYLLIQKRIDLHPMRYDAVLLDREGAPISGALSMPQPIGLSIAPVAASRNGSWIVAAWMPGGWRVGDVGESDFPPPGQERLLETVPLPLPSVSALAVSEHGLAAARLVYAPYPRQTIVFEWLDGDGFFEREAPRERARPVRAKSRVEIAVGSTVENLRLTLDGASAYVSYETTFPPPCWLCEGPSNSTIQHISPTGRVTPVDPKTLTDSMDASVSSTGSLAFWVDRRDGQLYAAPLAGATPSAPRHVSRSLAAHLGGALLAGGGAHLAVWLEEDLRTDRIAYRLLSDEGAPRTPHRILTNDATLFLAASDGHSFLVVWQEASRKKRGAVIASDGSAGPPFDLPAQEDLSDLSWDGTFYNLVSHGRVRPAELLRIAPDGSVAGTPVRITETDDWTMVRPVDGGYLALTVDTYGFGCMCGIGNEARAFVLDRDFLPDHRLDPWRDVALQWHTWSGQYDLATGGGHRLFVWNESTGTHVLGDDGVVREVPYDSNVPLRARWTGREFLVTAGGALARHAVTGELLGLIELPQGATAIDVTVDRAGVPIVLVRKDVDRVPRVSVLRLASWETASSGSAPATR